MTDNAESRIEGSANSEASVVEIQNDLKKEEDVEVRRNSRVKLENGNGNVPKDRESVSSRNDERWSKVLARYKDSRVSDRFSMRPSTDQYGLTEEVKERASRAFSIKVHNRQSSVNSVVLCQHRRRSTRDLKTKEGLTRAYKEELNNKEELSHAVSRLQLELDEKNEMFQQAVSFGEQVDEEVRKLKDDLSEQLDLNSLLQRENRMLKEKNYILGTTINEMTEAERDAQQALTNAEKTKELIEAEMVMHKEMTTRIQEDFISAQKDACYIDDGLKKELERLKQELNREKAVQESMEKAYKMLQQELDDTSKRLKKANTKIKKLDEALDENNGILLKLSAEKAHLDGDYDNLLDILNALEDELFQAREALENAGVTEYVRNRSFAQKTVLVESDLASQLAFVKEGSSYSNVERESAMTGSEADPDKLAKYGSSELVLVKPFRRQRSADTAPELPSVIREYLHITATAVKMHFPDLVDVTSETMIEKVRNQPFHLYYDHMMLYMREIRRQKVIEEQERKAAVEQGMANYPAPASSGMISRFLKLVQNKAIRISSRQSPLAKPVLPPNAISETGSSGGVFDALTSPTEGSRYMLKSVNSP